MNRAYARLALPLLALVWSALGVGCAGISRPSDLRPASHPLLEGVAPRTRLLPLARRADRRAPAEARAPERAKPETTTAPRGSSRPVEQAPSPKAPDARRAIVARLDALEGQRRIDERPASDIGLLRAALSDMRGVRSPGPSIAATRRSSRPVARPRAGDLIFFDGAGGAAEVAVVRAVRDDGAVSAVAVTRGAVRRIVVHPDDPHARRRAGRIVNTFLRARRADDEASAVYLAGQLFIDFRTPFD